MKKEITFLIKVMSGGGAERVISLLTNAFVQHEHSVTLIITHQNLCESDLSNINPKVNVVSLPDEILKEKKTSLLSKILMLFARLIGKISFEKGSVLKYYSRNYDSVAWLKKIFQKSQKYGSCCFPL